MPEAPEVRRIVDQMGALIVGKELKEVLLLSGRYFKKPPDGFKDFLNALPLIITDVKNQGKFIYFETNTEWNIWNTLGLTGGWNINSQETFNRATFRFSDERPVFFSDVRNFGTLKFVNSKSELKDKLKTLGPDVLMGDVSDGVFKTKIKNRGHKTLPEILMDQSVIAGVGNYIKAEALYLAELSPHRKGSSLTDDEIVKLNKAIHSVIKTSYLTGGSTFKTYADFYGQQGTFSSRFMVYGQKIDPAGNPIVKETTKDKRTTHWVPKIQK